MTRKINEGALVATGMDGRMDGLSDRQTQTVTQMYLQYCLLRNVTVILISITDLVNVH